MGVKGVRYFEVMRHKGLESFAADVGCWGRRFGDCDIRTTVCEPLAVSRLRFYGGSTYAEK